ncbi:hypothetical protein EVAR_94714_1 [Eumeta japonica]|uniref:Uncharacterized protein n=1 Tax=Eumeta variegata TaxID=151549 RepID=A0A4C1UXP1_EUMVA|nr:hypothetical protein EVAR_94714_1 [Eumeta japonica]
MTPLRHSGTPGQYRESHPVTILAAARKWALLNRPLPIPSVYAVPSQKAGNPLATFLSLQESTGGGGLRGSRISGILLKRNKKSHGEEGAIGTLNSMDEVQQLKQQFLLLHFVSPRIRMWSSNFTFYSVKVYHDRAGSCSCCNQITKDLCHQSGDNSTDGFLFSDQERERFEGTRQFARRRGQYLNCITSSSIAML